ncbi:MAG: hypothetical protein Q9227_007650 [Pyrenula ochraceoflavens]
MRTRSILSAVALLLSTPLASTAQIDARNTHSTTPAPPAASILSAYNIPSTLLPPNSPTATSLASALLAAQSSLATSGPVKSAASFLAAHLPSAQLDSLTANGFPHITTSAPPDWFTGLPSDVKSELLKEQSVIDGVVTSVLKLHTGSGSGNVANARATPPARREVVGAGVGLVGVLGVMALL